ncbi:cytochrome P450 [uncultured Mycobacterium sp.]|uniref:cytochrome P450 n=1 Tax=uncultured Mycobacterium sp. TaxID=171292 RepID=UPI0035CB7559
MDQGDRYDPRLSEWVQALKSEPHPQRHYHDKARDVRAERAPDGVVWLYRHNDILAINRHPGVLGTGGRGGSFGNDNPLIPLEIEGEDHRKWRRLLDPLFAPKRVALLDSVRQLARELIDGFLPKGEAELYNDFCVPLPCLTFLRLVGAPVADLDFFLEFKDGVIHPAGDSMEEMQANLVVAATKIYEYFVGFLAEKRKTADHEDDVIASLIKSEVDGEPMSDLNLVNILFLLMFAGLDTVTSSMSCAFAWLGQHPAERDRLVRDRSLIPAAVEEIMRYESPVPAGFRYAVEDIDLGGGLVIKAGEAIHASWAAANVDPTFYDDPLSVDFSRGRKDHMVFASGTHRCLGSHLARLEMRLATEELLDRIPNYTVGPEDSLIYDNVATRMVKRLPITFPVPAVAGT